MAHFVGGVADQKLWGGHSRPSPPASGGPGKKSHVVPIPKLQSPKSPADFRSISLKVTMDNLKCNYLATSPPFILQAVRSRRMKQVILEVDKTQLVVRGVQQPTL